MTLTRLTKLNIFDGETVSPHTSIEFDATGIVWLGDSNTDGRDTKGADNIIDCEGAWLLPGLMDAHIHLELDPNEKSPPAPDAPRDLEAMAERARLMVAAGITTARDLGGGVWAEFGIRDRILAGKIPGPRLICAGQPITSMGGHCHFWGGEVDTLEQARAVMQRQIDKGADLLKIMATGGRFTANSSPSKAQFEQSFMADLVQAANAANLSVAAHCHGSEGIRNATFAGVTTIEHCSWVGNDGKWASDYQPDTVTEMARRGVWVSPTVNANWQRFIDSGAKMLTAFRECYDKMRAAGVQLVASTDAGIPGVVHHELPKAVHVFAQIAGLSPDEAIRTATANAADALGVSTITGRVRTGLAADLLLFKENPLEDLTVLQRPVAIWARGAVIKAL